MFSFDLSDSDVEQLVEMRKFFDGPTTMEVYVGTTFYSEATINFDGLGVEDSESPSLRMNVSEKGLDPFKEVGIRIR